MNHQLDISKDHCPMTFVKTKLKLESLSSGEILEVILKEGELLENVPKTVTEQGYTVLSTEHIDGPVYKVTIQK